MEAAQCESITKMGKRVHDEVMGVSDYSQTEKKQKTAENEQFVVDEIEGADSASNNTGSDPNNDESPLCLNDINNHCLRHVFEFLSLHDQVQMAEVDDQFIFPAAEAFSCRYRTKRIEVLVTSGPFYTPSRYGYLRIKGAVAMAGLQHFGARMLTLSANFDAFQFIAPAERHPIDLAILKTCTDSLKTLEINFCTESHFETIEKPFKMVQKLVINGCTLGETFGRLNEWFPSLVDLKLSGVEFLQPAAMETRFAHLTALHIVNDIDAQISERTIRQILRLNGQLTTLKLRCDYGAGVLLAIAEYSKQLALLELWMPTDRFASFTAAQKISLTMLKTLILHASATHAACEKMPFALTNVAELRLYGFYQYHPLIVELIASGVQLNAISMVPSKQQGAPSQLPSPVDHEAFKQAILTRTELKELELCVDEFIGDDLQGFIDDSKHMDVLRLMTSNLDNFQVLQIRTDEWALVEPDAKIYLIDLEINSFAIHFEVFHHLAIKRNK